MTRAVGRARRALVVGVFAAALLGGFVVDRLRPTAPPRAPEHRARREAAARAAERALDGGVCARVAADLAAASYVGRATRPLYGAALFAATRALPPGVALDDAGRFYVRERSSRPPRPQETAEHAAALVRAVARRFAERGSRLVFCLVPEKDLVHADAAPPGVAGDRAAYAALLARLAAAGIAAPDLLAALARTHAAGEEPFFATDTHWTFAGASAAAEAAADAAGLRVPPASRTSRVDDAFTTDAPSDVLHYAGFGADDPATRARIRRLLAPHAEPRPFVFRRVVGADGAPWDFDPLARDRVATVVGTSYSDYYVAPWFPAFVAHAIDRPVRSHALGASGAGVPLLRSAEISLGAGYAPTTFWETPSSLVFAAPEPLEDVAEFFAFAPPKRSRRVLDAAAPGALAAGEVPPSDAEFRLRGTRRFRFRDGVVGADGGGGVGIKLAGDVRRGEIRVRVAVAGRALSVVWRAGQAELTLPILAAGTEGVAVELTADDAVVFWRRAALVANADPDRLGEVVATCAGDGRGIFPRGAAARPGALAETTLPATGAGGRVAVLLRAPSGAVVAHEAGFARPGATLYCDAYASEGAWDSATVLLDAAPCAGARVALLPPPAP